MPKTKLSNHLMIVRRKLGLSRKQVAVALGYSLRTVARHEQGKLIPPLETLLKLEILYQMPVAYLYQDFYAELRDGLRQQLREKREATVQKEVGHA